ncbi:hypothetical protein [Phocaeicola sp. HCN-6420]|jgi:hypothetical protein|uniref:hypothetical protein n=1 Tax=Phocaeicola sp. HCN-6420 TaxID=3134673 RepID=UPI0030C5EB68
MKLNTIMISMFLSGCLLAGTTPFYAQVRNNKGLKKGVNLAVNITNKKKEPPRTYVNLGLISNYPCLNGVGLNVISSITHYHSQGFQVAGITNVTGLNANGFQFSGIANVTGKNTKGIAIAGLMNVNGNSMSGLGISALGNVAGLNENGISISGLINIAGRNSSGVNIAGLANITRRTQEGLIIGGLMNVAGETMNGIQLTSLLNVAGTKNNGVQLAGLGNIAVENRGLQLGIANYGEQNKGLQAGIANVSSQTSKGLQLGIVNISQDSAAHQIGCVNINPMTRVQMIVSSGNLNKINVAVRFKNRHTYTELGGGAFYLNTDYKLSASAFYRGGVYCSLLPRLELSADAGFYHIETLDNKHEGLPARLYALQPRINLEYRMGRKIGIFASGGYSWTRQYGHSRMFDHKATFEAGIVLF